MATTTHSRVLFHLISPQINEVLDLVWHMVHPLLLDQLPCVEVWVVVVHESASTVSIPWFLTDISEEHNSPKEGTK